MIEANEQTAMEVLNILTTGLHKVGGWDSIGWYRQMQLAHLGDKGSKVGTFITEVEVHSSVVQGTAEMEGVEFNTKERTAPRYPDFRIKPFRPNKPLIDADEIGKEKKSVMPVEEKIKEKTKTALDRTGPDISDVFQMVGLNEISGANRLGIKVETCQKFLSGKKPVPNYIAKQLGQIVTDAFRNTPKVKRTFIPYKSGAIVKELLDIAKLDIEAAKKRLKISANYVYKLRTGEKPISTNLAIELADLFEEYKAEVPKAYTLRELREMKDEKVSSEQSALAPQPVR